MRPHSSRSLLVTFGIICSRVIQQMTSEASCGRRMEQPGRRAGMNKLLQAWKKKMTIELAHAHRLIRVAAEVTWPLQLTHLM